VREAPLKPEEILGAKEEPAVRPLHPGQPQRGRQAALRFKRGVAVDVAPAHRGHLRRRGDPLEQRRFSGTVLAHEECHLGGEVERLQRANCRYREWKRFALWFVL
jgi:hypothetical protein